jgi:hypothetical protein
MRLPDSGIQRKGYYKKAWDSADCKRSELIKKGNFSLARDSFHWRTNQNPKCTVGALTYWILEQEINLKWVKLENYIYNDGSKANGKAKHQFNIKILNWCFSTWKSTLTEFQHQNVKFNHFHFFRFSQWEGDWMVMVRRNPLLQQPQSDSWTSSCSGIIYLLNWKC